MRTKILIGGNSSLNNNTKELLNIYLIEILKELDPYTNKLISKLAYTIKNHKSFLLFIKLIDEKKLLNKYIEDFINCHLNNKNLKYNIIINLLKNNHKEIISIVNTISKNPLLLEQFKNFIISISKESNQTNKKNGGCKNIDNIIQINNEFIDKFSDILNIFLYNINKHTNIIEIINNITPNVILYKFLLNIKEYIVEFIVNSIIPILIQYKDCIDEIHKLFLCENNKLVYFTFFDKDNGQLSELFLYKEYKKSGGDLKKITKHFKNTTKAISTTLDNLVKNTTKTINTTVLATTNAPTLIQFIQILYNIKNKFNNVLNKSCKL